MSVSNDYQEQGNKNINEFLAAVDDKSDWNPIAEKGGVKVSDMYIYYGVPSNNPGFSKICLFQQRFFC